MTQKEPSELSPVFARAQKVLPRVEQGGNPWIMPVGVVGAVFIGVTVFSSLSKGREERIETPVAAIPVEAAVAEVAAPPPPPPVVAPPMPVAPPQVNRQPDSNEANLRAPAVVYDVGGSTPQPVQAAQAGAAPPGAPGAGRIRHCPGLMNSSLNTSSFGTSIHFL